MATLKLEETSGPDEDCAWAVSSTEECVTVGLSHLLH